MSVVNAGALGFREVVVEPFRVVHWFIWDLQGQAAILADEGSIFIFDLERKRLHKLVGDESYGWCEITEVVCEENVTRVTIHIDVQRDLTAGLAPEKPWNDITRMYELAKIHKPTRKRIHRLLVRRRR